MTAFPALWTDMFALLHGLDETGAAEGVAAGSGHWFAQQVQAQRAFELFGRGQERGRGE